GARVRCREAPEGCAGGRLCHPGRRQRQGAEEASARRAPRQQCLRLPRRLSPVAGTQRTSQTDMIRKRATVMFRAISISVLLILALVSIALAADVTGKWKGPMEGTGADVGGQGDRKSTRLNSSH